MGKVRRKQWRRRLGKKNSVKFKTFTAVIIFLECFYGISRVSLQSVQLNSIVQSEHIYQMEWVMPASEPESHNIYGVWFDREAWKLQFYHTDQHMITD